MHYWSYCCRRYQHHYHNGCHQHSPYNQGMRGSSLLAAYPPRIPKALFCRPATLCARLCPACKALTCRRVDGSRHVGGHGSRHVTAAGGLPVMSTRAKGAMQPSMLMRPVLPLVRTNPGRATRMRRRRLTRWRRLCTPCEFASITRSSCFRARRRATNTKMSNNKVKRHLRTY